MTSSIKKGKDPTDLELKKKLPSFMFCKWLSGNRNTLQMAYIFNLYSKIPIKNQFLAVRSKFQGKVNFIQFPKKFQKDESKKIDVIQEMLNMSYDKSLDYLLYISDKEYNDLETAYNIIRSR